jgi:hypothetical protein
VDFRIRAYDRNGLFIPTRLVKYVTPVPGGNVTNYTGNADLAPQILPVLTSPYTWLDANQDPVFTNGNVFFFPEPTGDYRYDFRSNAVPAYVEVELGILESPTLARLQAYTNSAGPTAAYWNYLTNHTGQVHIFRQRVNIPAADPAAYP